MRRILILVGHPDPAPGRFCRALAEAYAAGARRGGHEVRSQDVATLDVPLIDSQRAWESGEMPAPIRDVVEDLRWCDHLVLIYPLWLGDVPAKLKAFLEQALRPDGLVPKDPRPFVAKPLTGRSARVVVTMGMPGFYYRIMYGSHSLKSLCRSVLGFVGFGPIRRDIVGMVAAPGEGRRAGWLARMARLGEQAR